MAAKKKNSNTKYIGFVLFILACAVMGYFFGQMIGALAIPKSTMPLLLVLFIPAFFIATAIHEAGHAFLGVMVKFDFKIYVVGPLLWEKEPSGWKFKWNTNINTAGGLVICLPKNNKDISKRFALFAAGGPLASLLLVGLASGLAYICAIYFPSHPNLKFVCILLAGLSTLVFIVTIIPFRTGGLSSDGARILTMLKGGDQARFETLILTIVARTSSGTRPRLLDLKELEEAKKLGEQLNAAFRIYLPGIFHQVAFDKHELDEAETYLAEHLAVIDEMPKGLNAIVWLDAAFFYAYARKDLALATLYWEKFKPAAMIPKAQVLATAAAIAALKDEKDLGLAKIADALKELPNMLDKGISIALHEKLLQLKSDLAAKN